MHVDGIHVGCKLRCDSGWYGMVDGTWHGMAHGMVHGMVYGMVNGMHVGCKDPHIRASCGQTSSCFKFQ